MKQSARLFVIAFVAVGSTCDGSETLPPFRAADRILVGQLESMSIASELIDPGEIAALLQFANSRRQDEWSTFPPYKHGGQCSLRLTFMVDGVAIGYFALEGRSFFSNGRSWEANRLASTEEARSLVVLVPAEKRPEKLQSGKCRGP